MLFSLYGALLALVGTASAYVDDDTTRQLLGSSGGVDNVGLWIDRYQQNAKWRAGGNQWGTNLAPGTLTDTPPSKNNYKAYCWPQPVSHFDTTAPQTKFCQRYWVNADYYKPGGPVIVYDGGEGAADPFHSPSGMVWKLAQKYGVPVPDFSTDNLRFLNYKDSLQDSAEFIRNWYKALPTDVAASLAQRNITSIALHPSNTPWLYYGCSYPGGRAAHMRLLFPDLVHGALSNSGVTLATTNLWQYYSRAAMQYGDQKCVKVLQDAISTIDSILDKGSVAAYQLKQLFGVEALTDEDFAAVLRRPPGTWQTRFWSKNTSVFNDEFCPILMKQSTLATTIVNGTINVPASVVNYAQWTRDIELKKCTSGNIKGCFAAGQDYSKFVGVDQEWRLWTWQVCTEWGYSFPAPPAGQPSIISRRLKSEYDHRICNSGFAPGKYFSVPPTPNVNEINKLGGLSISADRLAVIGGDGDPWRAATLAADVVDGGSVRVASDSQPFWIIPDAGHCYTYWEMSYEPQRIKDVHAYMYSFVGKWLPEFKPKGIK